MCVGYCDAPLVGIAFSSAPSARSNRVAPLLHRPWRYGDEADVHRGAGTGVFKMLTLLTAMYLVVRATSSQVRGSSLIPTAEAAMPWDTYRRQCMRTRPHDMFEIQPPYPTANARENTAEIIIYIAQFG